MLRLIRSVIFYHKSRKAVVIWLDQQERARRYLR